MKRVTETYDPNMYTKISYDDLVTYALFRLASLKKRPSFENLVAMAFRLFPSRFHLIGYSAWPDSALINKSWLRCRGKGYISGDISRGFTLAPIGLKIAESVNSKLHPAENNSELVRLKGDERSRAGKFVKHIEKSKAFKLFKSNKLEEISSLDFLELIFCTPDSLPQTKIENLKEIREYLRLYNRDDMKKLLDFCETKFANELKLQERLGMIKRNPV